MSSPPPASTDWLDALRGLADNLIGAARERIDRLGQEVEEEKARLIGLLVAILAGLFAGLMAVAFLSFTIVALCPPGARAAVLGGLTLIYALSALLIYLRVRRTLREPPPLSSGFRAFLLWGPAAAQLLHSRRREHH